MRQAVHCIALRTAGKGLTEITEPVRRWLAEQKIATGLLTLYCRHTSASLLIQENADPDVQRDLARWFDEIAPEEAGRYLHDTEGPDDMPAHIRAALGAIQLAIPIAAGRLLLGTWQGIYLFEHRKAPQQREIALHVMGE